MVLRFRSPSVKKADKWAFDPKLGKQELIDRRVGENELSTIQTLLSIVDAQDEYVTSDPEKKGAREYASAASSAHRENGMGSTGRRTMKPERKALSGHSLRKPQRLGTSRLLRAEETRRSCPSTAIISGC